MFELNGRVALVTGAGCGNLPGREGRGGRIGFGIARALARQGAAVAVNDIHPERAEEAADEIRKEGGSAIAAPFDITDRAATSAAIGGIESALGPIGILVNNAGLHGASTMTTIPFAELDESHWDAPMDANFWGGLHCIKRVLPGMKEAGWGRIIYISSEAGRVGLHINVPLYGAAKAAGAHFMRHLAHEVGKAGITCNGISVGLVGGSSNQELEEYALANMPSPRLGTKDDIAAAAVFFASKEAEWITGQILPVNGGEYTF